MKLRPYVEKLEQSKEYSEFKTKYPDAFLVAGFFVLDLEANQHVHQVDFYLPTEKKIAAFTLDKEVQLQLMNLTGKTIPKELRLDTTLDLDALQGVLQDEMHNRGMSESIKKIIAILQNIDGKRIWNLNCVLSGMEILKSHIEDESKSVLKLEKQSLMDIMKKIPQQAPMMRNPPAGKKEDFKTELHNLDKLEKEIDKERARIANEQKKK